MRALKTRPLARLRAAALPVMLALASCESIPENPSIWTTGDLANAIEANLASVGQAVSGTWTLAGGDCRTAPIDMSLGADRPAFMPDVAALVALVPGSELSYQGRGADRGEQVYRLGASGGQATIVRDLRTDAIVWRRPGGDEMRLSPDSITFQSGRLSLHLDADTVRIQIAGASLVELERCGWP